MYISKHSVPLRRRLWWTFSLSLILGLLAVLLEGCVSVKKVGPIVPNFVEGELVGSIEQAQSRVDFTILKPWELPQGYEFLGAATSPSTESKTQYSRLVYVKGEARIIIGQGFSDTSKFLPLTDEYLEEYRQQRITIQGHPGMGHERETRLVLHVPAPADRSSISPLHTPEGQPISPIPMTLEEAATLRWWPPGQEVAIWTDDMSLTLADLIAIAESVEPLK